MESLPVLTHEYVLVNPPKIQYPTNVSVAHHVLQEIKKFGNSMALTMTLAKALKLNGIKPGDVVGICSENRLEYVTAVLGILAVGATCFPINPIYTKYELMHILSIAKPILIFCSPLAIDKINSVRLEMPFIKKIIVFSDISDLNKNIIPYSKFMESSKDQTFSIERVIAEGTVAFLFCSSGTTGLPKCVELTHSNMMSVLNFIWLLWGKEESESKTVTLGLIPFFHGYGCLIWLISLLLGTYCVVMPRFEEENFLHSIQKYKISHLHVVPPIVVFLSKHPLVLKYDLSSVRKVVSGAAPLSKETQLAAQKRLKLNFNIQQGYGMTELSICCVAFQSNYEKIGSSGTIAPGMQLKVIDLETKKALPPYGQGELCFKGPFVMKGYKNNPEETCKAFDSEGWFHTGDVGYFDNDGFIFIVSRIKELIKYKGFQVAPAELETILLEHPAINEAGVIGIPNEEAGELPLAFVVKQPGANVTEEEIKNYVAGKVSPQKRLHGGVRFINSIPKNPSGKILKRELKAMLEKSKL